MRAFGPAGMPFVLGVLLGTAVQARAADTGSGMGTPPTSVLDAARESLFGDVYVEPTGWRELRFPTFLTEGWNEAWASPVTGGGGAPRQGWLNAFDGVFYRLVIGTFDYANDAGENGDAYAGSAML